MDYLGKINLNDKLYKIKANSDVSKTMKDHNIHVFTIMGHIISLGAETIESSLFNDIAIMAENSGITIIAHILEKEITILAIIQNENIFKK